MRLTLRTLLAWLDDTLPPAEVRQIGKQVSESPFAQDLVDRTYRVTRQRRLLIPSSTGPEATDPNLVAAYLDGELSAEEVAEYEKKCLTSDVNLAEVASVHQILSLIGQKAKVPPEARQRMYRLVKGRETTAAKSVKSITPPVVIEPAPSRYEWSSLSRSRRPLVERLGLAGLILGLLGVIVWTGFATLAPESGPPTAVPSPKPIADPAAPLVKTVPERGGDADQVARPGSELAIAKKADVASSEKTEPDKTVLDDGKKLASGSPLRLAKGPTLAFGWINESNSWGRLDDTMTLKDEIKILNLDPFWSTIQSESARATLIGGSEISISRGDKKSALRLGIGHGRFLLKGAGDGLPYLLSHGDQTISILAPAPVVIGLERTWNLPAGSTVVSPPVLSLFVAGGDATIKIGEKTQTLSGPTSATISDTGEIKMISKPVFPTWLNDSGLKPSEAELGERYLKFFSPKGSLIRDLVQAVDSEEPDVRRLAIEGLGALGDGEMVVPVLNNAMTDAGTRRAAAAVLRSMLARGGAAAKNVRDELEQVFGADLADDSEKLLIGFTGEEAKRESTYVELVKLLSTPELGTREMALRALMSLTGRDSLEYDPTKPEGRGLKAWQDLMHKKELIKTPPEGAKPGL